MTIFYTWTLGILASFLLITPVLSQQKFYSSGISTQWNDPNAWLVTSLEGTRELAEPSINQTPSQLDKVIIGLGHQFTDNFIADTLRCYSLHLTGQGALLYIEGGVFEVSERIILEPFTQLNIHNTQVKVNAAIWQRAYSQCNLQNATMTVGTSWHEGITQEAWHLKGKKARLQSNHSVITLFPNAQKQTDNALIFAADSTEVQLYNSKLIIGDTLRGKGLVKWRQSEQETCFFYMEKSIVKIGYGSIQTHLNANCHLDIDSSIFSLGSTCLLQEADPDKFDLYGNINLKNHSSFTCNGSLNLSNLSQENSQVNINGSLYIKDGSNFHLQSGVFDIGQHTYWRFEQCHFPRDPEYSTKIHFAGVNSRLGQNAPLKLGDGDLFPAFKDTAGLFIEISGGMVTVPSRLELDDANAQLLLTGGQLKFSNTGSTLFQTQSNPFLKLQRGIFGASKGQVTWVHHGQKNETAIFCNEIGPSGNPYARIHDHYDSTNNNQLDLSQLIFTINGNNHSDTPSKAFKLSFKESDAVKLPMVAIDLSANQSIYFDTLEENNFLALPPKINIKSGGFDLRKTKGKHPSDSIKIHPKAQLITDQPDQYFNHQTHMEVTPLSEFHWKNIEASAWLPKQDSIKCLLVLDGDGTKIIEQHLTLMGGLKYQAGQLLLKDTLSINHHLIFDNAKALDLSTTFPKGFFQVKDQATVDLTFKGSSIRAFPFSTLWKEVYCSLENPDDSITFPHTLHAQSLTLLKGRMIPQKQLIAEKTITLETALQGTLCLNGATPQVILGTGKIDTLIIDNHSGISIAGNLSIDSSLQIINGKCQINEYLIFQGQPNITIDPKYGSLITGNTRGKGAILWHNVPASSHYKLPFFIPSNNLENHPLEFTLPDTFTDQDTLCIQWITEKHPFAKHPTDSISGFLSLTANKPLKGIEITTDNPNAYWFKNWEGHHWSQQPFSNKATVKLNLSKTRTDCLISADDISYEPLVFETIANGLFSDSSIWKNQQVPFQQQDKSTIVHIHHDILLATLKDSLHIDGLTIDNAATFQYPWNSLPLSINRVEGEGILSIHFNGNTQVFSIGKSDLNDLIKDSGILQLNTDTTLVYLNDDLAGNITLSGAGIFTLLHDEFTCHARSLTFTDSVTLTLPEDTDFYCFSNIHLKDQSSLQLASGNHFFYKRLIFDALTTFQSTQTSSNFSKINLYNDLILKGNFINKGASKMIIEGDKDRSLLSHQPLPNTQLIIKTSPSCTVTVKDQFLPVYKTAPLQLLSGILNWQNTGTFQYPTSFQIPSTAQLTLDHTTAIFKINTPILNDYGVLLGGTLQIKKGKLTSDHHILYKGNNAKLLIENGTVETDKSFMPYQLSSRVYFAQKGGVLQVGKVENSSNLYKNHIADFSLTNNSTVDISGGQIIINHPSIKDGKAFMIAENTQGEIKNGSIVLNMDTLSLSKSTNIGFYSSLPLNLLAFKGEKFFGTFGGINGKMHDITVDTLVLDKGIQLNTYQTNASQTDNDPFNVTVNELLHNKGLIDIGFNQQINCLGKVIMNDSAYFVFNGDQPFTQQIASTVSGQQIDLSLSLGFNQNGKIIYQQKLKDANKNHRIETSFPFEFMIQGNLDTLNSTATIATDFPVHHNWIYQNNKQDTIVGEIDQRSIMIQLDAQKNHYRFGWEEASQALPLTLLEYNLLKDLNAYQLIWKTIDEYQVNHFDIQLSNNGYDFITIGTIPASGTSQTVNHYAYTIPKDQLNFSIQQYIRLVEVDDDDTKTYFTIFPTSTTKDDAPHLKLQVGPNPIKKGQKLYLIKPNEIPKATNVTIRSLNGVNVFSKIVNENSVDIPFNVPSGIYTLQIIYHNHLFQELLIIQ